MAKHTLILAIASLFLVAGCGKGDPQASGPIEGTVVKSTDTPEERIRKIQEDPNIPAEYKQTYINSVKAGGGGVPAPPQ